MVCPRVECGACMVKFREIVSVRMRREGTHISAYLLSN